MANRVVLNCRKISRSVTCAVTGMKFSTTGRTVIVDDNDVDDDDNIDKYHDDDGVITTNDVGGGGGGSGKKEVFSDSEEDSGEGVSGLGLLPTVNYP